MGESRAKRFIDAYNSIDDSLRKQYNVKRSLSFTDLLKRTSICNSIVKRYEDDLVDYSRLRNAIVHGNDDSKPIAEPNIEVVEDIERIAQLIKKPPQALKKIWSGDVLTIPPSLSIKDTICKIAKSGYSNIPVYDGNEFIGIANGQKILDALGNAISSGFDANEFITNNTVLDILKSTSFENYYIIASPEINVREVLDCFNDNRKLLVILATKDGTSNTLPVGIITPSNLVEINQLLDDYDEWRK